MLRPVFAAVRFSSLRLLAGLAAVFAARLRSLPAGLAKARAVLGAGACLLAVGGLLAACSPTYDWRTIMNNDNGYTVDLPAKPSNDARQIQIGGASMQMAMQTAEAGKAVFAVGTVMLPSDDPQTQRTALDFLRDGLARNVSAAPDAHTVQIPLAAGGQVPGLEMTLNGKAGEAKETRTIYARLVAHGRHVYQAAIIANQPLPQEQVDQFFQSFQLY
ncbi:hypothetical protein [Paraburkholderia phenazinium]|jgi:hypothetical protein|uniref:Transmembrane protein n=1 Tax=Paraburkholderia phenazinium TaxID=60549 RepID=A0A1G7NVN5_9BURK|nr:hypothetical protein [Paraburkholderia phenazinium]SDF78082.1 hypothetical protein SAMN05216466_10154 [Paraburkholderia phenazinium]